MGAGPIPVRDLSEPDEGPSCDGGMLSVPRGRGRRGKAHAISAGPPVRAAAERHAVEVQVSLRDPAARGFAPLPVRWRIEATFGTLTNRYRRLTRNLEQSPEAAENVVEVANLRRILRVLTRSA